MRAPTRADLLLRAACERNSEIRVAFTRTTKIRAYFRSRVTRSDPGSLFFPIFKESPTRVTSKSRGFPRSRYEEETGRLPASCAIIQWHSSNQLRQGHIPSSFRYLCRDHWIVSRSDRRRSSQSDRRPEQSRAAERQTCPTRFSTRHRRVAP